jgi:lipopolysaccharide export LptBFGC system permease protein LptF
MSMGRFVKWQEEERGVTLVELLAACMILALVITGICFWINQTWASTKATQTASANEQQATTIMSQLVQEIHKSQGDANGTYVAISANAVTITTPSGFVSYSKQGSEIIYTNATNQQIVLTDYGNLQVQTADQKTFAITVTVGATDDPNHVTQTTKVTRYDWGK